MDNAHASKNSPGSSRKRPRSGYGTNRSNFDSQNLDNSRNVKSVDSYESLTSNSRKKSSMDSPPSEASSADSGINTEIVDTKQTSAYSKMAHSNEYTSRRSSARLRAKQVKSDCSGSDHEKIFTETPTSKSRPSSSSSFSRFSVLPNIGHSAGNTPEPYSSDDSTSKKYSTEIPKHYSNVVSDLENMDIHSERKPLNENPNRRRSPRVKPKKKSTGEYKAVNPKQKAVKEHLEFNETDEDGDEDYDQIKFMFPPLRRKTVMPAEPTANQPQLLLAIKLPDGQRVQRNFKLTDNISTVVQFSECISKLDLSSCELICDAPRRVFKDHGVQLLDINLQNRTVLHINRSEDS